MAIQLQVGETSIPRIVQAIIQLVLGRHNACGEISLTPGAASTVVSHPNCSIDCKPQISARSANAAAALATTYISSIDQGQFTLTHAVAGTADRTFCYTCTGG